MPHASQSDEDDRARRSHHGVGDGDGDGPAPSSPGRLVPVTGHGVGEAELAAVARVLGSGGLTTGPETALFEKELAGHFGTGPVLAVNSCTAALHLALLCLGVGAGDEVITSVLTFPATVNAVLAVGAVPVLVDVDPRTLNISPAAVAAAVTPRTRAVVPIHMGGAACDMTALRDIADRHSLPLVADAAHAVDTRTGGRHIAGEADVSCFSFYATKNLTSVEGGALTGPAEIVDRARLLARHGLRFSWDPALPATAASYEAVAAGWKYNLSDVHAAVGRTQLARLPELQRARRDVVRIYDDALAGLPGVELPHRTSTEEHSWYLYQIQLTAVSDGHGPDGHGPRDRVAERLRRAGIVTGSYYAPLSRNAFLASVCRVPERPVHAEAVWQRLLALPVHPGVSAADARWIAARLTAALAEEDQG
ncbi:DegT/DnrJ/EryC1/StrS family aminotransferase [Streptomyces sp. NPDC056672]|uniref:DegT/DnrJ/EryC1/StrS family aminotransferase n=1 Tax=Streptomyces sp. NPDC056672 TaxID=3345906 RepID=UPI0036B92DE4